MSCCEIKPIIGLYIVFVYLIVILSCSKTESVTERAFADAKSGLRMRSRPGLVDSKVILLIKKNEEISILDRNGPEETIDEKTGHWYKVDYQGNIGWVFSPLVKVTYSDGDH